MDEDVGEGFAHQRLDGGTVGDVEEVELRFGEELADTVEAVFAVVDQNELFRPEPAALEGNLAPDAPSGSGDEDFFASDKAFDRRRVEVFGVADEELLDREGGDRLAAVGEEGGSFDLRNPGLGEEAVAFAHPLEREGGVEDRRRDPVAFDDVSHRFAPDDRKVLDRPADHVAVFPLYGGDGDGVVGAFPF